MKIKDLNAVKAEENKENLNKSNVSHRIEKSCGAVIYKIESNEVKYLLEQSSRNGSWGFPKGHIENNETELETAARELFEEVHVKFNYIPNFRYEMKYAIPELNIREKTVIFFISKFDQNYDVIAQKEEVSDIKWVNFETAKSLITFENSIDLLTKADDFIKKL